MFHEGDLQSGIARAVQQAKAVLCFVYDDSDISSSWEATVLDLQGLLASKAVALRLKAGSQEAKFLASFCRLNSTPAVVVIKNGTLYEHLQATGDSAIPVDGLRERLKSALEDSRETNNIQTGSADPVSPRHALHENAAPADPDTVYQPHESTVSTQSTTSTAPIAPIASQSSTVPTIAVPQLATQPSPQEAQRTNYVRMQQDRERAQREERERIKKQIKADREERRRRDELLKQPAAHSTSDGSHAPAGPPVTKKMEVRVQVRTFDGSTLRSTFAVSANISSELRPWIDMQVSEVRSVPYNLTLILTPLPNRNIEPAEEEQSLSDLGIRGSCTFVMVPVKGFVDSYTSSTAGGLIGSVVAGGYDLVSGTAGWALGSAKSLLGWGSGQEEEANQEAGGSRTEGIAGEQQATKSTVRVRTLADQRMEAAKRKDQQFYNGNALNFEPRKDDTSKED